MSQIQSDEITDYEIFRQIVSTHTVFISIIFRIW